MLTKDEILSTISRINEEKFKELNGRQIISVSKMEEFLCEKFDAETMAASCAKKGAENPDYKYAGMTAEEILNPGNVYLVTKENDEELDEESGPFMLVVNYDEFSTRWAKNVVKITVNE